MRRDQKSDFANASGFGLMKANLLQLLGVQQATDTAPGDVAWDGSIGSRVKLNIHRNGSPASDELTRVRIMQAVARELPTIRITNVHIQRNKSRQTIEIRFVPTDGNGRDIGEEQGLDVPVPEQ